MRPARSRAPVFAAAILLLTAIVALRLGGFSGSAVLYLLPALLLLAPLVLGRYPGERLLRAVIDRPRCRRAPGKPPRPRHIALLASVPRGGALLASALAGRAPPAGWLRTSTSPGT
jgi:hypothetical protein